MDDFKLDSDGIGDEFKNKNTCNISIVSLSKSTTSL